MYLGIFSRSHLKKRRINDWCDWKQFFNILKCFPKKSFIPFIGLSNVVVGWLKCKLLYLLILQILRCSNRIQGPKADGWTVKQVPYTPDLEFDNIFRLMYSWLSIMISHTLLKVYKECTTFREQKQYWQCPIILSKWHRENNDNFLTLIGDVH